MDNTIEKGIELIENEKYDEAMEFFFDIAQEYPNYSKPYSYMALISIYQEEYEHINNSADWALINNPNDDLALYCKGIHYYTVKNDLKLAKKYFDKAIYINPCNFKYQREKISLYYTNYLNYANYEAIKDKYYNLIIDEIPKALKLSPDEESLKPLLQIRTYLFIENEEKEKALDHLSRILKTTPEDIEMIKLRALVYSEMFKDVEKALEDLRVAKELNPNDPEIDDEINKIMKRKN
jgi:tetratricopeptide (TPR) repeat protein